MRAVSAALRERVEHLDAGRCAYCRSLQEVELSPFEIDHIVPSSAGGPTEENNLCLACPSCNRFKAARQYAVDPLTGEIVPLFHPRNQRWSEHFEWAAGTLEVVGRTPTGRATLSLLRLNRPHALHLRHLWRRWRIMPWAGFIDLEEQP
jgi:hypothetical protein